MIIDPTTDVAQFVGARVVIDHNRTARILAIRHGSQAVRCAAALRDGVWGDCVEDPHGGCWGGHTTFWWPYGTDLALHEPA